MCSGTRYWTHSSCWIANWWQHLFWNRMSLWGRRTSPKASGSTTSPELESRIIKTHLAIISFTAPMTTIFLSS
jgi:hypothetical protein